jgi:hypothetical protein
MLISAREACDLLIRDGVSRRGALKVLASGLAGPAVRAHHVVLYDQARVEELAARPSVHWPDAAEWSPGGFFPFVATVGGLVAFGADIVEVKGFSKVVLEQPGSWFEDVAGCWFPTGPGRPWVLYVGALAAGRAGPEKIAG